MNKHCKNGGVGLLFLVGEINQNKLLSF